MMDQVVYQPIGYVESPFRHPTNVPVQTVAGMNETGKIILEDKYKAGLQDLKKFTHLILIYHFHLSKGYTLTAKPFLDDKEHGIFAIKGPRRPNPIGISTVKLLDICDNKLMISGIDLVDGTPILDIKPFIPEFDNRLDASSGWLNKTKEEIECKKSDDRFALNL